MQTNPFFSNIFQYFPYPLISIPKSSTKIPKVSKESITLYSLVTIVRIYRTSFD